MREVLEDTERRSGRPESGLRIDIPDVCAELWSTFLALSTARRNGMGMQSLVWADIEAWCGLYKVELTTWELDTLTAMDRAALNAVAEVQAEFREQT